MTWSGALLAAALVMLASEVAVADEPAPPPLVSAKPKPAPELRWDEERPRFRVVEYVLTGIVGPLAIAEYFVMPSQQQPHWVGGILFDDAVRDALLLKSPDTMRASWAMADTAGVTLVALSVGLDSIIVPLLRRSPDVAWQLTLMDAEAFSFSSIVAITLYDTVGRARPNYEECQKNPSTVGCSTSPFASFPSGHINEAFTAAGLSCAHHLFQHVYGSRTADIFACARDGALAVTEGMLRIMGDRHWATDVLVGGAIGFTFGFGMTSVLHYVKWNRRSPVKALTLAPMMGQAVGIVAAGGF